MSSLADFKQSRTNFLRAGEHKIKKWIQPITGKKNFSKWKNP
jgi:hypothetical protein